jgi:hypothetical protein
MAILSLLRDVAFAAALAAVASIDAVAQANSASISDRGEMQLATSQREGPIRLGGEPVHIELTGDFARFMRSRKRGAPSARHVYLVLDEIRRKRQPGVLFEIFLSEPNDGVWKMDSARYVGDFNVFEQREFWSVDATEHLEAFVAAGRSAKIIVTIRPALGADPSARSELLRVIDEAEVTVARVRLVAQ